MIGEEKQGLLLDHGAEAFQQNLPIVLLVDLHIDLICLAECLDFQMVSVCALSSHRVQIVMEALIDLAFRGHLVVDGAIRGSASA